MDGIMVERKAQLFKAMQQAAEGNGHAQAICSIFFQYCPEAELDIRPLSIFMDEGVYYRHLAKLKSEGRLYQFPYSIRSYEEYRAEIATNRQLEMGEFILNRPKQISKDDLMLYSPAIDLDSYNPCLAFNTPAAAWTPLALYRTDGPEQIRPIVVFRSDIRITEFWAGICGLDAVMDALTKRNDWSVQYENISNLVEIVSERVELPIQRYIGGVMASTNIYTDEKIRKVTNRLKNIFNDCFGPPLSDPEKLARRLFVIDAISIANKSQRQYILEKNEKYSKNKST